MKQNNSFKFLRRSKILSALELCESDSQKIEILMDKIVELQDSLIELQQTYMELLFKFKNFTGSCLTF